MATSMLLLRTALIRLQPHPLTSSSSSVSAAYSTSCLSGNVPWVSIFPLGNQTASFSRPFSSNPDGDHMEAKNVEDFERGAAVTTHNQDGELFVGTALDKTQITVTNPLNTVAAAYSRCLTGSVKLPWAVTSPFSRKLTSFANRPFSSKPVGFDVAKELEYATNQYQVGTDLLKKLVSRMCDTDDDFGFKIFEAPDGNAWVKFSHLGTLLQYSLSQICPLIFTECKISRESSIGRPFEKAVILVPSSFNDAQRQAAKNAATIAGLDVHRVITRESPEDAVPYGIHPVDGKDFLIAVIDFSGGTIDFRNLDLVTLDTLLKDIVRDVQRHGYDVTKDPLAHQRLEEAVKRAWEKKSPKIKIHMPVAAGEPEKILELKWTKLW